MTLIMQRKVAWVAKHFLFPNDSTSVCLFLRVVLRYLNRSVDKKTAKNSKRITVTTKKKRLIFRGYIVI